MKKLLIALLILGSSSAFAAFPMPCEMICNYQEATVTAKQTITLHWKDGEKVYTLAAVSGASIPSVIDLGTVDACKSLHQGALSLNIYLPGNTGDLSGLPKNLAPYLEDLHAYVKRYDPKVVMQDEFVVAEICDVRAYILDAKGQVQPQVLEKYYDSQLDIKYGTTRIVGKSASSHCGLDGSSIDDQYEIIAGFSVVPGYGKNMELASNRLRLFREAGVCLK